MALPGGEGLGRPRRAPAQAVFAAGCGFTDLCPGPVRRPPFPKASVVSSQVLGRGEPGLLVGEQVWGSLCGAPAGPILWMFLDTATGRVPALHLWPRRGCEAVVRALRSGRLGDGLRPLREPQPHGRVHGDPVGVAPGGGVQLPFCPLIPASGSRMQVPPRGHRCGGS